MFSSTGMYELTNQRSTPTMTRAMRMVSNDMIRFSLRYKSKQRILRFPKPAMFKRFLKSRLTIVHRLLKRYLFAENKSLLTILLQHIPVCYTQFNPSIFLSSSSGIIAGFGYTHTIAV